MSEKIFEIAENSPIVKRILSNYVDKDHDAVGVVDLLENIIDELVNENNRLKNSIKRINDRFEPYDW
jgi:hypothetical protein